MPFDKSQSRNRLRGPDFLCIGAMKAGTTFMHRTLSTHRQVWLPPMKEQHFFNRPYTAPETDPRFPRAKTRLEEMKQAQACGTELDAIQIRDLVYLERFLGLFDSGVRSLAEYRLLFEPAGELVSGDITPAYATLSPDHVMEIEDAFPDIPVFFIAREPLSRIWSQARQFERKLGKPLTTDRDEFEAFVNTPGVTSRSEYTRSCKIWTHHFQDRFHILFYDDLCERPVEFFKGICETIGIDPEPEAMTAKFAPFDRQKPPLPPAFRDIALAMLDGEHERFAAFAGGRAKDWLEQRGH